MTRNIASVLFFLLVVPLLSNGASEKEGCVMVLDATNFFEVISSQSFIVVEFYASWCGPCKRLAPEYEKAAVVLKDHKPSIILAKVDAQKQMNKVLASKYDVRRVPTLKIFETNGRVVHNYKGPREADGIVSYLKREACPPSNEILSAEQGELYVSEADVLVVGIFSSYDTKEFRDFITTASELRSEYNFKHTLNSSFLPRKTADLSGPTIRVFKSFDEGFNDFKEFHFAAVKNFLEEVTIPSVVLFNRDPLQLKYFSKIFANTQSTKVFLFLDVKDEGAEKITAVYKELSAEYKDKGLRFLIADTENGQKLLQKFEVSTEKLPSILIQGKDEAKHVLEGAKAEELESWLNDYFDYNLSSIRRPEPSQSKKRMKGLVTNTYGAMVLIFLKNGHVLAEALLVVVIVFLLLQKSYQPEKRPLTLQEIKQLCEEWSPEALHPPITPEMEMEVPVLQSTAGPRTLVNGEEVVNLSTANYLGLMGNEEILKECRKTLEKYGVGSCGPRGFYGTIDVHLDCEDKIAKFMGTKDSILYSYGLATAVSTIPAFCKRGDLILADKGVSWGIQNGLYLSRSTVKLFKHNDMDSLESLLVENHEKDKQTRKVLSRRFIVVEAIYQNSGQMAPLRDLIRLKEKYRFRLVLEESNSVGVLGDKGRGLTEHFNVPVEKVDIIIAAMGHALASAGGFCTGSAKVVDHQRLSGLGYVFSASLPPYVATASIAAIKRLQENPKLVSKLQQNVSDFRKALSNIPGLEIKSHPRSPTIFIQLKQTSDSFNKDYSILQRISNEMLREKSVLVSVTRRSALDTCELPAALKLGVSAGHTESDLLAAAASLKIVAASILPDSDCNKTVCVGCSLPTESSSFNTTRF